MFNILLFIYIIVLLYASYIDIKSRVVYNGVHIIILFISIINLILNFTKLNLVNAFLGCIISFIIFIIPNLLYDGSIGGGDIKFISSSGMFLGLINIIKAILIGLIVMLVIELLKCIINKKSIKNIKCALVPYLSIGCFFVAFFV